MSATTSTTGITNSLTAGRLPKWSTWLVLGASLAIMCAIFGFMAAGSGAEFNVVGAVVLGTILFDIAIFVLAYLVEGIRQAKDRLVTSLVVTAFIVALLPLISLLFTVISNGLARFDLTYFSSSMRNIVGEGGGALHAVTGTLLITGMAALISVPIGLLTAIYLVEYGKGNLARAITFFVDVMTGIPSIVAGLFAFALFALFFGPSIRLGFAGAVALSVLKVCWEGPNPERNCGHCEKCVRTRLNLLAVGIADAGCFDEPFDLSEVDRIKINVHPQFVELKTILDYAATHGVSGEWVTLLKRRLGAYKRRAALDGALATVRDRLRAGAGT